MSIVLKGAGLALAISIIASSAAAAPTPEQKCQGGKNKGAGGFAACLGKAESALAQTGDSAKYNATLLKCQGKYSNLWTKLEGGSCVTTGDGPDIEGFVEACSSAVAAALAGGDLPLDVATCNDDLDTCNTDVATCEDGLDDCNTDLGACEAEVQYCNDAFDHPLKRTGQTTCHTLNGNTGSNADAAIPCAGTGQDGELQKGSVPSYTDNGNGTITDNRTGLMWEKHSDNGGIHDKDTEYTVANAYGKIATLNSSSFAGHNDWRLPNRREVESLADIGRQYPAVHPVFHTGCTPGCNGITCSCTDSDVVWTSSVYILLDEANWSMNMTDGDIYAQYKSDTNIVRAVRDAY